LFIIIQIGYSGKYLYNIDKILTQCKIQQKKEGENVESKDIRENFLVFFENKNHLRLKSASLIPQDPTLLFTSAGMVPLKAYYLGEEEPPGKRIATVQKCLRTNDIDNVGYTARHHTFFEMLGNFSIGDYFKEEAIPWAYQYVTEVLNLPKDRLWISVYKDDLESKEIWEKVGIAPEKIILLGEKDNFWKMGTVGPCGPCSEIYFDRGIRKAGEEKQLPGDDGERFLEFWNLVFTQFDRQANGELKPLPKRNIDTGLGLERITSIIEGVETDFETDLFLPIIKKIEDISREKYGIDEKKDRSFRVIADHIRAISFLIAEGLVPTNEKRGYVLRRLIRRSALFGRELNLEESFLHRIIPVVVDSLNTFYPELNENKDKIISNVKSEEERFNLTLNGGFEYFKDQRKKIEASGGKEFSADAAFYLYDTLGFPVELTKLLLKEHNLNFNNEKFDEYLEEQRERARKAFSGGKSFAERVNLVKVKEEVGVTDFIGYDVLSSKVKVKGILKNGNLVSSAPEGEEVSIMLDKTPFYAEKGGQAGDKGIIKNEKFTFVVENTETPISDLIIHTGKIKSGSVKVGDTAEASVDSERRYAIMRAHTSVHILQGVLRSFFGENIGQQGSAVYPDEFRFDFNFTGKMDDEVFSKIEREINDIIMNGIPVCVKEMTLDEANKSGALAFFGDKYGDTVRVVGIEGVSKEFCGGTHVSDTGDIHCVVLKSFRSVASGIKRIEGLSGKKAYQAMLGKGRILKKIARILSTDEKSVPDRMEEIFTENKELKRELHQFKLKGIESALDDIILITEKDGIPFYFKEFYSASFAELRKALDMARKKLKKGVVLFSSVETDKVLLLVGKLADENVSSIEIFNKVSPLLNGRGGGNERLAQGSGAARISVKDLKEKL